MDPSNFQHTLRSFLRHQPFDPFLVELVDGRQITIDDPQAVAMNGAGAGFLSPEYDLVSFSSEQVQDIRPVTPEQAR